LLADGESGSPCLYLDLFRHHAEQSRGGMMFTPAVHVTYALQEALRELEESGGWPRRRVRYRWLSRRLRDGLAGLGLPMLLPEAACASSLTSFVLPDGWVFADMHARLKEEGFIIYPGQQSLQERIFRVAVMGDLTDDDLTQLLDAYARLGETDGTPQHPASLATV
jgi:2-aminoethylphosphonate-pyruvate transaminase